VVVVVLLCRYYFVFVVSIFEIKHLSNTNSADNNSSSSYESDGTQSKIQIRLDHLYLVHHILLHVMHHVKYLIMIVNVLVVQQVIDVKNHYLQRQQVYDLSVLYQFINIYSVHTQYFFSLTP
jgi:hypothetical protein